MSDLTPLFPGDGSLNFIQQAQFGIWQEFAHSSNREYLGNTGTPGVAYINQSPFEGQWLSQGSDLDNSSRFLPWNYAAERAQFWAERAISSEAGSLERLTANIFGPAFAMFDNENIIDTLTAGKNPLQFGKFLNWGKGLFGRGGNLGDNALNFAPFSKFAPINPSKLNKKFDTHAKDFGISGNFNKINGMRFNEAVQRHLNAPGTIEKLGTFRKNIPVNFHVNPKTGLTVIQNLDGSFLSGWKLGKEQLRNVMERGKL